MLILNVTGDEHIEFIIEIEQFLCCREIIMGHKMTDVQLMIDYLLRTKVHITYSFMLRCMISPFAGSLFYGLSWCSVYL